MGVAQRPAPRISSTSASTPSNPWLLKQAVGTGIDDAFSPPPAISHWFGPLYPTAMANGAIRPLADRAGYARRGAEAANTNGARPRTFIWSGDESPGSDSCLADT